MKSKSFKVKDLRVNLGSANINCGAQGKPLKFLEPAFLGLWNGTFQGQEGEKTC